MQREGQARSPTNSERDSAGLGGLVRIGNNPSGSRPNFFGRQHLTFDKGGKCDGAKQGIVRFWEVYAGRGVVVQSLRLDGKKFAT